MKEKVGLIKPLELTSIQQWERVNWFLLVSASIFILNAAFLLVSFDSEPIEIRKKLISAHQESVGFPRHLLAFITYIGKVKSFGDNENDVNFPKLPEHKKLAEYEYHDFPFWRYGVYYKSSMYFITCDPNGLVTKYDIDEDFHVQIPESGIPNVHLHHVRALHVGRYLWIYDGLHYPDRGGIQVQKKTSLWVLDKQKWIQGPSIPDFFQTYDDFLCVNPLNSTTVFFLRKFGYSYYDFADFRWFHLETKEQNIGDYSSIACTISQDKLGQMFLYKIDKLSITSDNIQFTRHKFEDPFFTLEELELIPFKVYKIGKMITFQACVYYIHGYNTREYKMEPIYQVFENGTLVYKGEHPFKEEVETNFTVEIADVEIAPFYKRTFQKVLINLV